MIRAEFFKGKSVLVTGNTGFVGSWLTLWLDKLCGANVIGFSLKEPVSEPNLYEILGLERSGVREVRGDIRDEKSVNKLISDYEPELIFHLAAQPILLDSYKDPVKTYTTNVIGTMNLLDAVHKSGKPKAVVNVTTDKVYQNEGLKAYKESDKLGGFDPYSSSKACSELVTQSYRDSFLSGIGVATARAGNILGGGDFGRHRLVPDIFRSKGKVTIRNPKSIRPFTFILDVLDGYMTLAEMLYKSPAEYSEAWNFSSDFNKTVIELVDEFKMFYPIDYEIKSDAKDKKHEDNFLLLDSTKAKARLKWRPSLGFNDTVKHTADWYAMYLGDKKADMLRYSTDQIKAIKG